MLVFLKIYIAASGMMFLFWLVQERNKNANIVDALWAYGIGFSSIYLAFSEAESPKLRTLLVLISSTLWSVRLGSHLLLTRAFKSQEDERYLKLRKQWKKKSSLVFFITYQIQALLIVLFSLPIWAAYQNHSTNSVNDIFAMTLTLLAVGGEWIADQQLLAYQKRKQPKPEVCNSGLWKYSRHPNYFFEWLGWCSYTLYGISSPYILFCVSGPILMYFFLNYLTGINLLEANSLKKRGKAYEEYQQNTSRFFPWFPKK